MHIPNNLITVNYANEYELENDCINCDHFISNPEPDDGFCYMHQNIPHETCLRRSSGGMTCLPFPN